LFFLIVKKVPANRGDIKPYYWFAPSIPTTTPKSATPSIKAAAIIIAV
jgi:hypothetical protein